MTRRRPPHRPRARTPEALGHRALAIVCAHVLAGERPVLLVWRDREDDAVGLACGEPDHPTADDWSLAHPVHVLAHDPGVAVLSMLHPGAAVRRDRPGAPWRPWDEPAG